MSTQASNQTGIKLYDGAQAGKRDLMAYKPGGQTQFTYYAYRGTESIRYERNRPYEVEGSVSPEPGDMRVTRFSACGGYSRIYVDSYHPISDPTKGDLELKGNPSLSRDGDTMTRGSFSYRSCEKRDLALLEYPGDIPCGSYGFARVMSDGKPETMEIFHMQ